MNHNKWTKSVASHSRYERVSRAQGKPWDYCRRYYRGRIDHNRWTKFNSRVSNGWVLVYRSISHIYLSWCLFLYILSFHKFIENVCRKFRYLEIATCFKMIPFELFLNIILDDPPVNVKHVLCISNKILGVHHPSRFRSTMSPKTSIYAQLSRRLIMNTLSSI